MLFAVLGALSGLSGSAAAAAPYSSDTILAARSAGTVRLPEGVGVDQTNGDVLIADTHDNRVSTFDASTGALNGNPVSSYGSPAAEFNQPRDVATDIDGDRYVLDTLGMKVVVFSPSGAELLSFGDAGAAPLNESRQIAVDTSATPHVYVADTFNNRVVRYSVDLSAKTATMDYAITDAGSGSTLSFPEGVAVQGSTVWISDTNNQRIRVYTAGSSSATLNVSWDGADPNNVNPGCGSPDQLAVDPAGHRLFVTCNDLVYEYDMPGSGSGSTITYLNMIGGGFGGQSQSVATLQVPQGIRVSSVVHKLYIADQFANQVVGVNYSTSNATLTFDRAFGFPAPGQLVIPGAVALDGAGHVWVADSWGERVQELGADGSPMHSYAFTPGDYPQHPSAVAVNSAGTVMYAADGGNGNYSDLLRYSLDGSGGVVGSPTQLGGPADGTSPSVGDLATGPAGDLFAADTPHHRVLVYDPSGAYSFTIDTGSSTNPAAVAVGGSSPLQLYVGFQGGSGPAIVRYTVDVGGKTATVDSGFTADAQVSSPTRLAWDPAGQHLFAADESGNVLELSGTGTLVAQWQPPAPADAGGQSGVRGQAGGLAVDAAGNLLATDAYYDEVHKFALGPTGKTLSVSRAGTGAGTVTQVVGAGATSQIDCGVTCSAQFSPGTQVTLKATNANGSTFTGWSAPGCSGATCTVTMSSDQTVTASFSSPGGGIAVNWQNNITGFVKQSNGFSGPEGVSILGSNVLVADTPNGKVEEFDPTGKQLQSWGSPGNGNGQLANPRQAAAAQGQLDVSDSYNGRVETFDAQGPTWTGSFTGSFNLPRGIAADPSGQHVLVADTLDNQVMVYNAAGTTLQSTITGAGTPSGPLQNPESAAMDSSGHIWVADTYNNRIVEFDASGNPLAIWGNDLLDRPTGIAVDSSGNVWVVDWGHGSVRVFDPTGALRTTVTEAQAGDSLSGPVTVAVNASDGDAFVADAGHNRIVRYSTTAPPSASPVAPDVVTGNATVAPGGGLNLPGTVNPKSQQTTWFFQYSTYADISYAGGGKPATVAGEVPVKDPGGRLLDSRTGDPAVDSSAHDVATKVSGLTAGTHYYYRLVAHNGGGYTYGTILSATPGTPPVATTQATSSVSSAELDLQGSVVDAGGLDTHYYFQWATSKQALSDSQVVPGLPGTDVGTAGGQASARLTGLQPNTSYCFRLVAVNAAGKTLGHNANSGDPGTSDGLCQQTSGPPIAPKVTTGNATMAAGGGGLNLAGTVNPESQQTTWFFQYSTFSDVSYAGGGKPASVAGEVPIRDPGGVLIDSRSGNPAADTTTHDVATPVTGLTPGTLYHYRLVAHNAAGYTYGTILSTGVATSPFARTGTASAGALNSLHLTGSVNPGYDPSTTWFFQYSVHSDVGGAGDRLPTDAAGEVPAINPGIPLNQSDDTEHPVGADPVNLVPGTVYYYRLVARNHYGTYYGDIKTQLTGGAAPAVDSMEVSQMSLTGGSLPVRADAGTTTFHAAGLPFDMPQVSSVDQLYAGGRTAVRMFAHTTIPINAWLYAYEQGKLVGGPIGASSAGIPDLTAATSVAVKRLNQNGGLTWILPSDWTNHRTHPLTLVGVIVPTTAPTPGQCQDCTPLNGLAVANVDFTDVKPLTIDLVDLNASSDSKHPDKTPSADEWTRLNQGVALLPSNVTLNPNYVAHVDTSDADFVPKDSGLQDANTQAHTDLMTWATGANVSRQPLGELTLGLSSYQYHFGVTTYRLSDRNHPVLNVQDDPSSNRPLTSIAHELSHAIGLNHASNCGGGAGGDWPPDQQGYLHGYGLDLRASVTSFLPVVGTAVTTYDYMSYCATVGGGDLDSWISPQNWGKEISILHGLLSPAKSAADRAAASSVHGGLLVTATAAGGHTDITSVSSATGAPQGTSSGVTLQVKDAAGHQLGDVPMTVARGHADPGSHGQPAEAVGQYMARIPAAASNVTMLAGSTVLAQRTRSPHAPVVRILAPAARSTVGGNHPPVVRWSATDADKDALQIAVDYSADGGTTWREIYLGPNRGRVTLPSTMLAASRHARVRVVANDGFNETSALSGLFTSLGAPPTVIVTSPRSRSQFADDAPLLLQGYAFDDAGHRLTGRSLRWLLGRRLLGTGTSVTVTGLPVGLRMITLRARDRLGRVSSSVVVVRMRPTPPHLLTFKVPGRVSPSATSLTVRLQSLLPCTARIGRAHRKLGRRAVSWRVPIKPGRRPLGLTLVLTADGKRTTIPISIARR